jgi:hypothetical protein
LTQSKELEKQLEFVRGEELALNRLHVQFRNIVKLKASEPALNVDNIQAYDFRTAGDQLRCLHDELSKTKEINNELIEKIQVECLEKCDALKAMRESELQSDARAELLSQEQCVRQELQSTLTACERRMEAVCTELLDAHQAMNALHISHTGGSDYYASSDPREREGVVACFPDSGTLREKLEALDSIAKARIASIIALIEIHAHGERQLARERDSLESGALLLKARLEEVSGERTAEVRRSFHRLLAYMPRCTP